MRYRNSCSYIKSFIGIPGKRKWELLRERRGEYRDGGGGGTVDLHMHNKYYAFHFGKCMREEEEEEFSSLFHFHRIIIMIVESKEEKRVTASSSSSSSYLYNNKY